MSTPHCSATLAAHHPKTLNRSPSTLHPSASHLLRRSEQLLIHSEQPEIEQPVEAVGTLPAHARRDLREGQRRKRVRGALLFVGQEDFCDGGFHLHYTRRRRLALIGLVP